MYIYKSNYNYLCYKSAFKNLKQTVTVLEEDTDLPQ